MRKTVIILIIIFSGVTLNSKSAAGQVLTFSYEGIIDTINDNENDAIPGLHLGQEFHGWFQYEIVPDQDSSIYHGEYNQDTSIAVTLDDLTISYLDDFVYVRVYNIGAGSPSNDAFSFAVDGGEVDYNFTYFGIELEDSTDTVFDSDALPISFDLTQFDSTRFKLHGYKLPNWDWFSAEGQLTSLVQIPEPGTILLLGFGAVMLGKRKR